MGTRSPARAKYFKGKFYDNTAQETRLNFPIGFSNNSLGGKKTAIARDRQKTT